MTTAEAAAKMTCPRCLSGRSITTKGDFYGDYLACLVCGWNGEADESGAPVMVQIPPPPIKRRRRRKRLPDGRLVDPAEIGGGDAAPAVERERTG
jgi:hypothetical protein